ncbi:MAG: hypothetical protein VX278_14890 [Myxococcota bacterium]|nr:hypothetical protein [Myxococcota bacterium]
MQFLATYLKLSQDFGGNEFGPYEDLEISLGSNQASCNIYIPPNFGVLPIHAKIIRKSPTDVVLTPAEQSAEIYLWKGRSRKPIPIYVPTAVKSGDSFALVSPAGPKFTIEFRELPPEIVKQRQESIAKKKGLSGMGRLNKDSMKAEVKRQAFTSLLVSAPAQLAQRALVFIKSGAIFQPRNIIIGLTLMSGWAFGGWSSCSRRTVIKQKETVEYKYKECQEDNAYIESLKEDRDYSFEAIVAWVTASEKLSRYLDDDKEIKNLVKQEAVSLFETDFKSNEYKWLLGENKGLSTQYKSWVKQVRAYDGLDSETKYLLTWMPPVEDTRRKTFSTILNSAEEETCSRGILKLTYRQAAQLGVEAQPDGIFIGKAKSISTPVKQFNVLQDNIVKYRLEEDLIPPVYRDPEDGEKNTEPKPETDKEKTKTQNTFCVYQTGDDQRDNNRSVLNALKRQYNRPDMEKSRPLAKLARVYAADLNNHNFTDKKFKSPINFEKKSIGIQLSKAEVSGTDWVKKKTAKAVARSLVIPCVIALKGDDDIKKVFFDEEYPEPDVIACFALSWRLQEDN